MPEVFAVAIDETAYYNIAPEDRPFIKQILNVYAYNNGEQTYCCELTPSFWLDPVYTALVLTRAADARADRDEIQERLEQKYGYENHEGCYMHVRDVERIPEGEYRKNCGEFDTFEDGREYIQGNCPL